MSIKAMMIFVILFLAAGWLGLRFTQQELLPEGIAEARHGQVTYIIDGDTLELASGDRVRLIGIDAPERNEPGYAEAKEALKALLPLGTRVVIELGADTYDQYGRVLAYLYHDGVFINQELLEGGWATVLTIPPNTKYQALLYAAHKRAQEQRLGLFQTIE